MITEQQIKSIFPEEKDIPQDFVLETPLVQDAYLVNGELRHWNGPQQPVLSPLFLRTPQGLKQMPLGSFPLLTEKEALDALDSAVKAYDNGTGLWPTLSVEKRITHIEGFVRRMQEKRAQVTRLLSWEIGKSRQDSEKEFDRTVQYILDTLEALKELDRVSSRFLIEDHIIAQIRRSSLGVVLCMGPFNYPLNETFTTLIPALIMGNTVVLKPPRLGVLLFSPLLEAFRDSFPAGVINCIYGKGQQIVTPLMASGKIDVLAFIGSSKTADVLKKLHPKAHRLRCVLGLDAKNAGIILSDADLDLTVKECLLGTLSFNGQRCTALKILFVHSQIIDEFLARFGQALDKLKCGMPWEDNVDITPIAEFEKSLYLGGLVENARSNGARVINQFGGLINQTFFYPALLYPVNSKMRVYYEEQFGPLIPVVPFDDIQEPIRYIIESNYGQQVSLFGCDPAVIAKLIDPLVNQVCRVNINSQCQRGPDIFPFNGRKDSAEGTLSVSDALRVFSIRTIVAAKDTSLNKGIITSIARERKSNFLTTDFIL
jgi:glyceraldehyde-3-phosphate dehydrogenase (NADP+)